MVRRRNVGDTHEDKELEIFRKKQAESLAKKRTPVVTAHNDLGQPFVIKQVLQIPGRTTVRVVGIAGLDIGLARVRLALVVAAGVWRNAAVAQTDKVLDLIPPLERRVGVSMNLVRRFLRSPKTHLVEELRKAVHKKNRVLWWSLGRDVAVRCAVRRRVSPEGDEGRRATAHSFRCWPGQTS